MRHNSVGLVVDGPGKHHESPTPAQAHSREMKFIAIVPVLSPHTQLMQN